MMFKFQKCNWVEIKEIATTYYSENNVLIESYFEDHLLGSKHYQILSEGKIIGCFAIHKETMIVMFNVIEEFRNQSQVIFAEVKKMEQVTCAMVPTGDEFFLSHCIDNFARLEKQAYFAIYTDKIMDKPFIQMQFSLADVQKDRDILKLSKDFLDSEIVKIENGNENESIYIVKLDEEVVGFGVIEYSSFLNYASIGMYVCEEFRGRGIARSILHQLKLIVQDKGSIAVSGCWYYNHNSKKSMESAGAYSKTRLLKFHF
ncbi:MAG: GCN5-related N-acetyltransferase [Bacillales bacterium]|jgi:GNAT superfamily N-acetyltransferase|nr:GCN5-related N-acetyltransferase [Bacillales bacterium]